MINFQALEANTLLSVINMKLRDYYHTLDILCEDLNIDKESLEKRLSEIGYSYNDNNNQFTNCERK